MEVEERDDEICRQTREHVQVEKIYLSMESQYERFDLLQGAPHDV